MKSPLIPIAIMPLAEAKLLKDQLHKQNIPLELNHEKSTCTRGCSITVEIYAHQENLPQIRKTLEENFKNMIGDAHYDLANFNHVFDPQSEKVTCPACSHQFSPTSSECPDCGLSFG